jgi:hypothetical protein
MDTSELIQAAAAIAGSLAAQSFNTGNISDGRIQEIARTAVTIAREIESEARRSFGWGGARAVDMSGWLKDRKRENEDNLKSTETRGFRLFQVTAHGGQVDVTEQHRDQLRAVIAEYQRAIDYLETKATGAVPPSGKPFGIK